MASNKFVCSRCEFGTKYDYFGDKPKFAGNIMLMEEAYVMKDPFTEDNRCIILGSHCFSCKKSVCVSQDCSLFYSKRFCLLCVEKHLGEFPSEIQMVKT
ncbi:hypothetical protein CAPTEDRAFT_102709 [Capitella teleta]|uniref:Cysteine-rich DPF motif domain-containing protein 1 n=1 Tax=Capitella teleta TaxID=283909 RepID=R7TDI5_CAPTE|nr:hypothetical protein CAPTEDRAFT_102709 [Capitella teleta]|eukprot:ELT89552.1 hypothetical protein CAPTEDRAFT_102709 [Capitella teleta]